MQVVEIATDGGATIGQQKFTLVITVDVDILPCPLGTPGRLFSVVSVGELLFRVVFAAGSRGVSHEVLLGFPPLIEPSEENL